MEAESGGGLGGGINKTILTKKETPPKGCSQNIEAAGTPGPTEGSGRHAPDRGCQRQLTGVKIIAKKKPGGEPGEFFACYKRNKFIC